MVIKQIRSKYRAVVSRLYILFFSLLIALAVPIGFASNLYAEKYDDQIKALEQNVNTYNAEVTRLQGEARSLQSELAKLSAEKAVIQTQIDLSQVKYDKLISNIKSNEQKIKNQQDVLGDVLADLYVDGGISPIEMLASSKNVSEYIDKQEYRNSVRDELTGMIKDIKILKNTLNEQKVLVEKVLSEQKIQQQTLVAKENEQQSILAQTQGEEAAYSALVASTTNQLEQVHAEQRAALQRVTNGGSNNAATVGSFQFRSFSGNQGCGGGYPYCAAQDTMSDPWALYNRECVSYSAWRATQMGKKVGSFSGKGNAYEWPSSTSGWMGAVVDSSPAVGAVAILPITPGFAPIGHSMNVEAILSDGWLRVSQYNFGGTGEYSTMDIRASGVVFVHFPSS